MSPRRNAGLRATLLLGTALLAAPLRAQTAADAPEFETFVVPKKAGGASAAEGGTAGNKAGGGTGNALAAGGRSPQPAPAADADRINSQVVLTLFPGLNDLNVSLAGEWAGRQVESQFSPFRWFQEGGTNPGYVQVMRGGSGVRAGDLYSNLLGSALGFRLSAPWKSQRGSVGVGLYQRLRDGSSSGQLLAMDSQWQVGRNWEMGLLVAADASWRFTQQSPRGRWQLSSFAGHDTRADRLEGGFLFEGRLLRSSSLYNRVVGWGGAQAGYTWSLGLTQQCGRGVLAVDHSVTSQHGGLLDQTGLGLLVPLRQHSLALRWQRSASDSEGRLGSGGRRSESLTGTLYSTLGPRSSAWASAGVAREESGRPRSFLTAGARRSVGQRWTALGELFLRGPEGQPRLRMEVGYQFDPEWQVRVLFGPSFASRTGEEGRHVVGAQIVRSFRLAFPDTGAVRGKILLDGQPYARQLSICLDREPRVHTDSRGQFRLRHCPTGTHVVRLDLASLPADLDPVQSEFAVEIERRRTQEVTFLLRRVGQIRGLVTAVPDAFGRVDPAATVGITITAGSGRETTTNAEGEFVFGGLPAGRYRVALAAGTIPPDYEVVGPSEVEVEVDPAAAGAASGVANRQAGPEASTGRAPSVVRFQIAPRNRKIQFDGETRSGPGEAAQEAGE
jgi:hypothetical protein